MIFCGENYKIAHCALINTVNREKMNSKKAETSHLTGGAHETAQRYPTLDVYHR